MSSSDPFAILELDRASATDVDVKRAYAKKLKNTRPDDDPKGFMELREAFESARRILKWQIEDAAYDYDDEEDDEDDHDDGDVAVENDLSPIETNPPVANEQTLETLYVSEDMSLGPEVEPGDEINRDPLHYDETVYAAESGPVEADVYEAEPEPAAPIEPNPVDRAIERLQAHFASPWGTTNLGALKTILEDPDIEGLDEFANFSHRVRSSLCSATGQYSSEHDGKVHIPDWLTLNVLKTLDNHFGWRAQQALDYQSREQNLWVQRIFDTFYILEGGSPRGKGKDFNADIGAIAPEEKRGISGAWLWGIWVVFFIALFVRMA